MLIVNTEIIIARSVKVVWENLVNFQNYADWNPYITSIEGDLEVGSTLKIQFPTVKMNTKIQVVRANKLLRWSAYMGFRGLLDSLHQFEIIEISSTRCRLVQSERFNGLLVPFFRKRIKASATADFQAMNRALKTLVENDLVA